MKFGVFKRLENDKELALPAIKTLLNLSTAGVAGAFIETAETYQQKIRNKQINAFKELASKQIQELQRKVSPDELKKRMKTPEFVQVLKNIYEKVEYESREELRKAYARLLRRFLEEDVTINFNQKLFYFSILKELNEHQIKILSIFYKTGDIKDRYDADRLWELMGCYELRKPLPGESIPFFSEDGTSEYLNQLKASYIKGLVSDLVRREIIRFVQDITTQPAFKKGENGEELTEIEGIETEVDEYYQGTELGRNFYQYVWGGD